MKLLSTLLAALFAVSATAPVVAQSPEPWKLVTMLPLTGAAAGFAQDLKLGFEIAVEDINRNGGIQGRPVTLQMLDSQSNPGQVAALIRQACNDSTIVVGPNLSVEAQVAFPVANSMQCPSFAPAAGGSSTLTSSNRPWAFSMISPASVTTPTAVEAVVRRVKAKKVVMIMEKADPASMAYADLALKTLAAQSIPVEPLNVQGSDVDFGPVITRAAAAKPDLIIISTLDRAAVGLLKELHKSRMPGTILLTASAFNTLVGQQPPELLENVYRFAHADLTISSDPRVKEFIKAYEAKSGGRAPSFVAGLPYDTMMVTKQVIEKAGLKGDVASRAADRKKFADTLQAVRDYDGLTGKVSMAPEGFMSKPPVVLLYRGGKWEEIKI